ncbi:hypothetical protein BASA83_009902 [Batrachochytrium salamandrivorans]|nr:hypothetical protein BASA83_009902 [Batrachochytrium salamandrivorans]
MDMMKTVDGGVHECDESDDVARGVLGRLENMVLAPRGETGSFTQMPPITHLYPHQPAKSSLLLPGTLHFGSAVHADTFFIDCGADDVFMDAELADRLKIPLVKIPVPIKLRLADGDSSSMITHRTLPLQLHIGRHVETIGFYVTSLCHGIILGYSWLERHNPKLIGNPEWWILVPITVWKIVALGRLGFKTSDSTVDLGTDPSLFKDLSMDLDLGVKRPALQVTNGTSKSVSFAETIQTEVYPFLEASPISETPIPSEISKEFSSVFSESQAYIAGTPQF